MPEINFNFETLAPTQLPPSLPSGALTNLSITQAGLTIDISRGQRSFDIVSNIDEQQKNTEFGQYSLTPFAEETDPTLFTINFSANVYRVSVVMGDYGKDEDALFMQAYSGLNATGDLLDTDTGTLPGSNTNDFSSQVLILESPTPIRSIQMIGGSAEFPNSVFYDNLTVDTPILSSDDTIATAQSIGVLSDDFTTQNSVSNVDADDYYQFSLPNTSDFSLALTDLTADADVELLDSNGVLIGSSYNAGIASEALNLSNLEAGTYYVRVNYYRGSQPSGETFYTLDLTTARTDSAGNTLSTARDIGTLGYIPTLYEDWVGNTDLRDYYQVTLADTSDLNLRLDNLNEDVDLYLIQDQNDNGIVDANEVLESSILSGTTSDEINVNRLAAGTYFVEVRAFDESDYALSLAATPSDFAGNTSATARNVPALSETPIIFNDFISDADPDDYYRFRLNRASDLTIQVTDFVSTGELATDADVELLRLNADGTVTAIALSNNSGTVSESIELTNLRAGIYLVRVYQYFGNTTYTLSLAATPFAPVDNAGNNLSTALDVGVLSATERSYGDWVGTSDTVDLYRFTLDSVSNVTLSLDGLSADADLYLIKDVNNDGIIDTDDILLYSARDGVVEEVIRAADLAAGSYFVGVTNYKDSNTFYTLSLRAVADSIGDWFDQNLRDTELIDLARSLATDDDQLSRNDMISLFRDAQDGDLITVTEQADLRTIAANFVRFNMLDYVRFLSSETANNIAADMTAAELEALIGRYFLGAETPGDRYTNKSSNPSDNTTTLLDHIAVQGTLYAPSVEQAKLEDVVQGRIANCYFVAALGAVAFSRPDLISDMVIDNGDGTYTIRFYQRNGSSFEAQYVTVDRRLAVEQGDDELLFADVGGRNTDDAENVLWAALIERAYAQWYKFYKNSASSDSGYTAIGNGGIPGYVLSEITGSGVEDLSTASVSFTAIQSALANDQPIAAARSNRNNTDLIRGWHAYTVVNAYVNSAGEQRIVLYNPWGIDGGTTVIGENDGFIELSFAEFRASLDQIYYDLPT